MSQWYGASERRLTQRLNQVCRRLRGASTIGEWELALRDGVQLFAEAFMLLRIEADWVAEVEGAREQEIQNCSRKGWPICQKSWT